MPPRSASAPSGGLGELMAAQRQTVGVAKGRDGACAKESRVKGKPAIADSPPTLAAAGIDKNLAHRARTHAAVPQERFEQLLTDKQEGESRRVVLDPDVHGAMGDVERCGRIAPAGADGLAAGNAALVRQVAGLRRRLAAERGERRAERLRKDVEGARSCRRLEVTFPRLRQGDLTGLPPERR